jgi:hypothetical protein
MLASGASIDAQYGTPSSSATAGTAEAARMAINNKDERSLDIAAA